MSPQLQLLPPVPPPVGLYIRPGWNDHVILQQLIVEGRAPTGLVFDARFGPRHQELMEVSVDANLDSVLDPNVQELWSPAGRLLTGLDAIRWSSIAGEGARGLRGPAGRQLVSMLADHVEENHFGSVLAPTHYLGGPTAEAGLVAWDPVHSAATERPSQCPITGNRTPPGSIQRRASSALCRLAAP